MTFNPEEWGLDLPVVKTVYETCPTCKDLPFSGRCPTCAGEGRIRLPLHEIRTNIRIAPDDR